MGADTRDRRSAARRRGIDSTGRPRGRPKVPELLAKHLSTTRSILHAVMHRSPATLPRAARALVGLVTIWCLGCSGYDPLLRSLVGANAGAMMACDPEMPMGAAGS